MMPVQLQTPSIRTRTLWTNFLRSWRNFVEGMADVWINRLFCRKPTPKEEKDIWLEAARKRNIESSDRAQKVLEDALRHMAEVQKEEEEEAKRNG